MIKYVIHENFFLQLQKWMTLENIIPLCLVFMYIVIIVIVMHYIHCLFHLIKDSSVHTIQWCLYAENQTVADIVNDVLLIDVMLFQAWDMQLTKNVKLMHNFSKTWILIWRILTLIFLKNHKVNNFLWMQELWTHLWHFKVNIKNRFF